MKGSLYFHFPGGKDELAFEALRIAALDWRGRLVAVLADRPPDVAADVRAVCAALAQELTDSGFANGCPLATVTLETAADHPALRELVEEHYREWERVIGARVVAGGIAPATAAALARLLLAAIEGALILARAYRDASPITDVAQTLLASVAPTPSSRTTTTGARGARPGGGARVEP